MEGERYNAVRILARNILNRCRRVMRSLNFAIPDSELLLPLVLLANISNFFNVNFSPLEFFVSENSSWTSVQSPSGIIRLNTMWASNRKYWIAVGVTWYSITDTRPENKTGLTCSVYHLGSFTELVCSRGCPINRKNQVCISWINQNIWHKSPSPPYFVLSLSSSK